MSRLGDWMTRAAKQTEAQAGLLNENEIFVRRMRGVGVLDRATALRYGVTGGNLRASGVPFRPPAAHPYSVYRNWISTSRPATRATHSARYLIRVDEVRESIKIVDQCLHNMPDGPVMARLPRLIRPRPGRAWGACEGPRGMLGVYTISDGSDGRSASESTTQLPHLETRAGAAAGQPAGRYDGRSLLARPVMGGIDK